MVRIPKEKLIEELRKNSRITNVDLANKFKVSETAIRKAIKRLEKSGIILSYNIEVDYKKLGYNVHALIGIDTTPETYLDIINLLDSDKRVFNLYSSTGDHMLMFESWFKNTKELDNYIKELNKIKGIVKICPAILLEKIK